MARFDFRLLGRHQVAAAIGTAADFAAMVALVEVAALASPIATFVAAIVGGTVNFGVSRVWAFPARSRAGLVDQAIRYSAVAFGSALLNGFALAAVIHVLPLSYVLARLMVSGLVSVFYNFPMHARLVFRVERT